MFKRIISLALSVVFSLQTCGFAQVAQLNLAGYLGRTGSVSALDRFRPASLRYFSYEPKTDGFRILLDKADEKGLSDIQVKEKTDELLKYFRIGLSLPNEKFWVNLRPDAPEQIIDDQLAMTDIGKIMLEADLQLKKDTASWTSPQTKEGKEYWNKLYRKAGELFGRENITIPTITRPWIVPGEIIVRESGDSAYIYKAALKVMLEEDYLTSRGGSRTAPTYQQYAFSDPRLKELNQYSTQLIRELIIPKLTKEVNRAKRYAGLRQVFYSLVLSRWFKDKFNQSQSGNELTKLIDSGNLSNLSSKQAWDKTTYFKAYQKSFKEGEYNLSEPVYTPTGQVIRRYMSGGTEFTSSALTVNNHYNAVSVEKIPFGTNSELLNYTSGGDNPVAIAASPVLESLKGKALGTLARYLYDEEGTYGKAYTYIHNTDSIAGLKKAFDNIAESFKDKVRDTRILDDFSNTLSVLITIEEVKIILEKTEQYVKTIYETYALLHKENQSKNLLDIVHKLTDTARKTKRLASEIEQKWAKTASSPISQEMKKIIEGIKQKTDELELILNKYEKQQGTFEEWEDLENLFEALKSLWIELGIRFWNSADPEAFLAREAAKIGIKRNLIKAADESRYGKVVYIMNATIHKFSLSETISIANTIYDRLYIERPRDQVEKGVGYVAIVLQRKGDEEYGRESLRLYLRSNSPDAPLEVKMHDEIRKELQKRVREGDTLEDIVGPIKDTLVQALKFGFEMELYMAKNRALELKDDFLWVLRQNGGYKLWENHKLSRLFVSLTKVSSFVEGLEVFITALTDGKVEFMKSYDNEKNNFQKSDQLVREWNKHWDNVSLAYDEMLAGFQEVQKKLRHGASSALTVEEAIELVKEAIWGRKIGPGQITFPIIAKAVAPEDFAKQVEEMHKSLGGSSSSLTKQVGGIDFRQMNMLIQPMGSFSGLDFSPIRLSSSTLESMDLDKELESVTRMASGGMLPSPQRLKEYISACILTGKIWEKADDFILSMLDVFQLQAEEGIESAAKEREAVVMADTRSYVLPEKEMAMGRSYSLN